MTPDLSSGTGIRFHQDADGGLHAVADLPAALFSGAFRIVRAGAMAVRSGLGTLEGRIPLIAGLPLHARRLPLLKLGSGPNEDLRSWVCLRVAVDLKEGALLEADDALQIVHVTDHALISADGLSPDDGQGHGYKALALLVWSSKKHLRQIVQNTWWNQRHSFIMPTGATRGHHLFRPDV